MNNISIDQISEFGSGSLKLQQKSEITIFKVSPPQASDQNSLVFASKPELFKEGLKNGAKAFIVLEKYVEAIKPLITPAMSIWTTQNIQGAMCEVLPLFDKIKEYNFFKIHPKSEIHPTAKIASTAHIGAFAYIGAHAVVGENTIIHPNSYVGHYCRIGNNCNIGPNSVIGADGFGYFTSADLSHTKIPQIGIVVIEDHCDFGAYCAIDRATLTETRIKKGSKFDNFCHVAHNCEIGENALVAAGFIVAGSTKIGKNLMTSGGVHSLGHLNIADNVILSARAGVLQDIEKSGMYGGYPLEPHKESVKTLASIPQLKNLRKQISKIIKHLNLEIED
jgi:UDP-3-O-[3-hydroxymyristoyl] glucosamine N-acyltransferase